MPREEPDTSQSQIDEIHRAAGDDEGTKHHNKNGSGESDSLKFPHVLMGLSLVMCVITQSPERGPRFKVTLQPQGTEACHAVVTNL